MPQIQLGRLLIASVIAALVGATGVVFSPLILSQPADMFLSPKEGRYVLESTFTTTIVVRSDVPTNVFAGQVLFDPDKLKVDSIDYNTSIADLWAVLPWYENGDGTLTFAGGTTRTGGFSGEGNLIDITFRAVGEGDGELRLVDARILQHDGMGTDISLKDAPIDAIFAIAPEILVEEIVSAPVPSISDIKVVRDKPKTDLNDDGKQGIKDVSIFMVQLASQNKSSDFNGDGKVSIADLSILLDAK